MRDEGYYWIRRKPYPTLTAWEVARWVEADPVGWWWSTQSPHPFSDSEVVEIGNRIYQPRPLNSGALSARLYDYARLLEVGEYIEGPGLSSDLADAAEQLSKGEADA